MEKSTKSAEAFRTISEVSEILDVPQHVLRFWEGKFSQIKPMKRGGNRRYYRPEDLELLRAITHLLYTDGYTIKGVQKLLRENGVRATVNAHIAEHGAFQDDRSPEELAEAAASLKEAQEDAPGGSDPVLDLPEDAVETAPMAIADSQPDVQSVSAAQPALANAADVIEELKSIQAILKP